MVWSPKSFSLLALSFRAYQGSEFTLALLELPNRGDSI